MKLYDRVVIEDVKIQHAQIYKPYHPKYEFMGGAKYGIRFDHTEPEFLDVGGFKMERTGCITKFFGVMGITAPIIESFNYRVLIEGLEIARARNIDPDFLFNGLIADVAVTPFTMRDPKHRKETILKFAFDGLYIDSHAFLTNAETYKIPERKNRTYDNTNNA